MSASVGDFVGTWYVKWVSGQKPFLQEGWRIVIGTGEAGATAPLLTDSYNVCMGFTIIDPAQPQTPVLSSNDQPDHPQTLLLMYDGGRLTWQGYHGGQPLWIYISLSQIASPAGGVASSLYGSTVWGDPDQVGVWGANDKAPSTPVSGGTSPS